MNTSLTGKNFVITGASSGFGQAIAQKLAQHGGHLILGARRVDRLQTLADQLAKYTDGVAVHALDVQSTASVCQFAQFCLTRGKVDSLINNAGLALDRAAIEDCLEDDWQTMLNTNVMGVFRMLKHFVPAMKGQGFGHIVNIGSIAGHESYEGGAGYCASKFGLRAVTETLRYETLGCGIRVTSIDPGLAETEFSLVRFKGDQDKAKEVYRGLSPLVGQDIADAVIFALSAPAHVNIDLIRLTPVQQGSSTRIHRQKK